MDIHKKNVLVCVECGSKYVINRKYCLCDNCNYIRIHEKSKRDVYTERATTKIQKPRSHIKKISATTRYKTSLGDTFSQAEVNYNYKETCFLIDNTREHICEGCGRGGVPLSHSHTISRARCKELGKIELYWDPDNLFLECFGAPSSNPTECHNMWEVSGLEKKKKLLNFDRKLEYIKIHDPETYRRYGGES